MSKFLKVIVNLFLVFAILVAGAILVPPLLGVSTTMIDSASLDTNLPVGSITYSQSISVSDVAVGDKILIEEDGSIYVYVVESADAAAGKFSVLDEKSHQTETQEKILRNDVLKVVLTVPFIAYLMVAMHSVEGLIIIGLVVLFVIILFILSELWKKSDDDDEDETEETEENDFDTDKAEALDAEPVETHQDTAYAAPETELTSEELARAVAETCQSETPVEDETMPADVSAENDVLEELDSPEEVECAQDIPEESEDAEFFVKVAKPSLEDILKKAEASGEKPEVVAYDDLDVTVVDYSEII